MPNETSLKELCRKERPLILPGAFNPLAARAIAAAGFKGAYLSGGALSASLGFPDIGLLTLEQVVGAARSILAASPLPLLVDADTGFGDADGVRQTVRALEETGASGLHIEDQVLPKRCGHLEGKELISEKEMCEKIRAAAGARRRKDFFIMARTDARGPEGLEAAIARARAYLKAGADGIFPEGLTSVEEFSAVAKALPKTILLANMTEFGKTPFISAAEFARLGYAIVIFPVTLLRLAMKAVEKGLNELNKKGSQKELIQIMQTRKELYDLLEYKL